MMTHAVQATAPLAPVPGSAGLVGHMVAVLAHAGLGDVGRGPG